MIYLDTSALTKLLVAEAETPALRAWLTEQQDAGEFAASSWLGRVELMRVVARVSDPALISQARYLTDGLDIIPLTESIISVAEVIGPASLRSLDAIHLAAAASIESVLTAFVTYNHRLRDGCRAVGLPVVSPGAAP